jgi:dihydrofolate synthase/folylpolyglutamate synthase
VIDAKDEHLVQTIAQEEHLPQYIAENMKLALGAMKLLKQTYSKENFQQARLFGRLTQLQRNVILDVGHNKLAAQAIVKALAPERYVLVYNTYKDKAYKEILQILKPIVKRVEIIAVRESRIESKEKLQEVLATLALPYQDFTKLHKEESYLVFGSFSVAQSFLQGTWNG